MPHFKHENRLQLVTGAQAGVRKGIIVSRVSSTEQKEGYSLPAQTKLLRAYAAEMGVEIVKEFSFAESAKQQGRKNFDAVLDFMRNNRDVTVAFFEKTDRLSRNMQDYVRVEELVESLDIEIHLVKERQILRKATNSQDRLVQGIFALLARNYIDNLREEIVKGQNIKAERGHYPGMAWYGYRHDRETRTIMEHPTNGKAVRLMFRLYATGEYSTDSLRKELIERTGVKISKSHLQRMLKSEFYIGKFTWRGIDYQGKHPKFVDHATFARVHELISGRNGNRLKSRKHAFAFSNLVICAKDGCMLTAEKAKGRYVYYHCSFGKGRHKVPYLPEAKLSEMLGAAVTRIQLPSHVANSILASLTADHQRIDTERMEVLRSTSKQLDEIEGFKHQAYQDRLSGLIDEKMWRTMSDKWRSEELHLQAVLEEATGKDLGSQIGLVQKTFELAQVSKNKWLTLSGPEQGKLAKIVLSNCSSDGVSLTFNYRKPFDLIVDRAKNEEWRRG